MSSSATREGWRPRGEAMGGRLTPMLAGASDGAPLSLALALHIARGTNNLSATTEFVSRGATVQAGMDLHTGTRGYIAAKWTVLVPRGKKLGNQ